MNEQTLKSILNNSEDSRHQSKRGFTHTDSLTTATKMALKQQESN